MKKKIVEILDDYRGFIMGILFLLFITWIAFGHINKKRILSENFTYVIATPIKTSGSETGLYVTFKYSLYGIKFEEEFSYDDCRDFKTSLRFYAKVSQKNPKTAIILYNKPVPNDIIIQPDGGWATLPAIDKTKIPISHCPISYFEDDEGCLTSMGYLFFGFCSLFILALIFYTRIKTYYFLRKESVENKNTKTLS